MERRSTGGASAPRLDRAQLASVGTFLLFVPTDSGLKPSDTRPHHSLPEAGGLCPGKESCPPSAYTPLASTPQVAHGANPVCNNVWSGQRDVQNWNLLLPFEYWEMSFYKAVF